MTYLDRLAFMTPSADADVLRLFRSPANRGTAVSQFEHAVTAIVAQAIEEDRATRARAVPAGATTGERDVTCPRCGAKAAAVVRGDCLWFVKPCVGCGRSWAGTLDGGGEKSPAPCPKCGGQAVTALVGDHVDVVPCPECGHKAARPPSSTMPAFPMRKEVDHDRVVLHREPREPGSAFEQFERTLRGYLDRHPVYRDCERVVYRDRPTAQAEADWHDDWDHDDDEDDWDDDEDEGEGEDGRATRSPSPPPSWASRLLAALSSELAADAVIREVARAWAREMSMGDIPAIARALDELHGADGRIKGRETATQEGESC